MIFRFPACSFKENALVEAAKPLLLIALATWKEDSKRLVPSKCFKNWIMLESLLEDTK